MFIRFMLMATDSCMRIVTRDLVFFVATVLRNAVFILSFGMFILMVQELCVIFGIDLIMQLQIKVFSGVSAMQSGTSVFERILDVHDDLRIPYESLVSDLKFLFGSSSIVSFNIL